MNTIQCVGQAVSRKDLSVGSILVKEVVWKPTWVYKMKQMMGQMSHHGIVWMPALILNPSHQHHIWLRPSVQWGANFLIHATIQSLLSLYATRMFRLVNLVICFMQLQMYSRTPKRNTWIDVSWSELEFASNWCIWGVLQGRTPQWRIIQQWMKQLKLILTKNYWRSITDAVRNMRQLIKGCV